MIKTIKIEKLANDGEGLAYFDNQPIFVYYALPGETVEAEVLENKRKALEGKIIEIHDESKEIGRASCRERV